MSTIILVQHEVADYLTWRRGFNEDIKAAQSHGFTAVSVLRDTTNKNNVTVLLQVQDVNVAKAFIVSDELREMMQKEGVIGKPDIQYLTDVTRG